MKNYGRVVQFIVPTEHPGAQSLRPKLAPERALTSTQIVSWLGFALILWIMIAISVLVI